MAIVDDSRGKKYIEFLKELKADGHGLIVIGLTDDQKLLGELGDVSNQRSSYYTLDDQSFPNVIEELKSEFYRYIMYLLFKINKKYHWN